MRWTLNFLSKYRILVFSVQMTHLRFSSVRLKPIYHQNEKYKFFKTLTQFHCHVLQEYLQTLILRLSFPVWNNSIQFNFESQYFLFYKSIFHMLVLFSVMSWKSPGYWICILQSSCFSAEFWLELAEACYTMFKQFVSLNKQCLFVFRFLNFCQ